MWCELVWYCRFEDFSAMLFPGFLGRLIISECEGSAVSIVSAVQTDQSYGRPDPQKTSVEPHLGQNRMPPRWPPHRSSLMLCERCLDVFLLLTVCERPLVSLDSICDPEGYVLFASSRFRLCQVC
jgi:hypothetical protein